MTEYINFCQQLCVEKTTITKYPNSNVWFNKSVRKCIIDKDKAYKNKLKDPATYRSAKSKLRKEICVAKSQHKDKLNEHFNTKDSKKLWSSMSLITNYKGASRSADAGDITLPDKLNNFYARFDRENSSSPSPHAVEEYSPPSFIISIDNVRLAFNKLNISKASGPDNISPRLLRLCSYQLAAPFCDIFNWSLQSYTVPDTFKMSTIIPVPKKASPQSFNDYRPVALTSVIMKCFESIFKVFIQSLLPSDFDPYQFAYRKNRSVEDAVSLNIHEILDHLEKPNSYVRVLFLDYSSAFNNIIPKSLFEKLLVLDFPVDICNWILDFLVNRPQIVKIKNNMSSSLVLSTGAPQGCVLSPTLYSIFTHDCKALDHNTLIIKFADDTTNSGFILNDDNEEYFNQVQSIVKYSKDNNLPLNIPKTKELIIDFRKKKTAPPPPLFIDNTEVEIVTFFKFLGSIVNNTVTWNDHCESLISKARQRLYFLRKLKSFGVNNYIILTFYTAIIEKIVSQSITVWYTRASQQDLTKLNSIIRTSEKIVGFNLPSLQLIFESKMENNISNIMKDKFHPANKYFEFLPSGRRLRACYGNKRFVNSYIPSAIKYFNSKL